MQCHIYFEQTRNAKKTRKAKKNKQTVWVSPSSQTDNQEKAGQSTRSFTLFPFGHARWVAFVQTNKQTNKQTLFLEEFYTMKLLARWWWRGEGSHGDDEHITNGSGVKKREKRAAEGAIRTKGNQTRAIVREGMERGKNVTLSQILRPTNPTRYFGTPKE